MMHPTLVAALAAERHAELIRAAEHQRRLAAVARHSRRTSLTVGAARLSGLVAGLRSRIAAPTRPEVEFCCA